MFWASVWVLGLFEYRSGSQIWTNSQFFFVVVVVGGGGESGDHFPESSSFLQCWNDFF